MKIRRATRKALKRYTTEVSQRRMTSALHLCGGSLLPGDCRIRSLEPGMSRVHVRTENCPQPQCFRPLPMTLSWRFLLIVGPERARHVSWEGPETLLAGPLREEMPSDDLIRRIS